MAPARRVHRNNLDATSPPNNKTDNNLNEPAPPGPPSPHPAALPPRPAPQKKSSVRSTSPDLNIISVVLGDRLVTPWFPSLYREELVGLEPVERLYVCPRCFRYSAVGEHYVGHVGRCEAEVPGSVVYEREPYEIYELDGEDASLQLFTQNLSLFAKLFIENKSVCFDVNTFLYYLLVLHTDEPDSAPTTPNSLKRKKLPSSQSSAPSIFRPKKQIVGFFSKEKLSWDNNNLACILVFPPWQKTGLGQLLMGASYEISRREGRLGGPERPLSTLGKASYLTYWSRSVASTLLLQPPNRHLSVRELSDKTYMLPDDVVAALLHMGVLNSDAGGDGVATGDTTAITGEKKKRKKKDTSALGKKRKDGSVTLEKGRIRKWAARKNIDVDGAVVDVDGFVGMSWGQVEAEGEDEDGEGEVEVDGEEQDGAEE